VIDWDEAARDSARVLGVPAKIIRDQKDVAAMRAQKAQAQAQQQQAEQAAMAAQSAGAAAPAMKAMQSKPEPGSVMEGIQGAMQPQGLTNGATR
jgi:hypothetical protein